VRTRAKVLKIDNYSFLLPNEEAFPSNSIMVMPTNFKILNFVEGHEKLKIFSFDENNLLHSKVISENSVVDIMTTFTVVAIMLLLEIVVYLN